MRNVSTFFALVLWTAVCTGALADICLRHSPQHYFDNATVVFSGVVISIDEKPELSAINSDGLIEYEFKVGQVWKGPLEDHFLVYSYPGWDLHCGFEKGGNYLVYARARREEGDLLKVKCCGGPQQIHEALVDRVVLGVAVVVDSSIAVCMPSEAELLHKASLGDSTVAWKANRALEEYRKRKPYLD